RREFAVLLAICLLGCGKRHPGQAGAAGDAAQRLRIAVIPKGTTHEFWKSVHAGAVKASREFGADVIWKGPLKEDDLKQQIDLVQSFTAQRVSAIALAPLNDKALVSSVDGAQAAGVPVVIFDSALQGDRYVSFVATDNRLAGRQAGEHLTTLLGGKGNVVVLRYQEGSASTHDREQGFLEAIQKSAGIRIISDNQYGGATTESAFSASENLLLSQEAAKGKINGVFCPNESTTFGMLLALQKSGLAGKIRFVGFDASDKLVQGMVSGAIDALILQNPVEMGYLAVKTAVDKLQGHSVQKRVDTGSTVVTRDNMNQPQVAQLLKPDLAKWLGGG
ncbi:MAG TPA: substrate-binding domain-containing protein, partial [Polyangiaceae bacterium]